MRGRLHQARGPARRTIPFALILLSKCSWERQDDTALNSQTRLLTRWTTLGQFGSERILSTDMTSQRRETLAEQLPEPNL